MAIIYTYSKVTPTVYDSVVITDASDNNYTKTALLSEVVDLATTYDLTSIQNASDSDIKLTGSDASVDIVKLVAGTDISIVDSGSNITINSTGTTGTVTSVGTSNAMGGTSGITFVASTNPIVATGTIDLSFTGGIGDMWFADTVSSVQLMHIGTSTTYLPTGSVSNQVLAVDSTGIDPVPAWTTKEIVIQNSGSDIETATKKINFIGAGITASSTAAGSVEIEVLGGGGGGVTEGFGTFIPCLVTQGINGTGALEELIAKTGTMTYVEQFGRWYIINRQIYFDFQIAFTLGPEPSSTAVIDTLGISAYDETGVTPEDKVLGLENINPLLADLNPIKNQNAGIDICDVYSFGGSDPAIKGWDHMPQGGKLNKFHGDGTGFSSKGVAWLHWVDHTMNNMSTQYEVPVADGTWVNMDSDSENTRTFYIAGSLNPINYLED